MAFERAKTIEKLVSDLAQKDRIIHVLHDESESFRRSEIEANKKSNEANQSMERMRQTHFALVEEMGHRNTTVMSEMDAALKELNELKAKLFKIIKEMDDAKDAA